MRNLILSILLFAPLCLWSANKGSNYNNLPSDTVHVNTNLAKEDTTVRVLKEATVSAETVKHYASYDEILITPKMRKGSWNTEEMLGKIQGMNYNYSIHELRYNGQKNIIILVDSIERPQSYIRNLDHNRFVRVQITEQPQGKYSDYDVMINLITKKNYQGYELNTANLAHINTGGKNGKDTPIKSESAFTNFTYTRDKWNFYGAYSYDWNDIHMSKSYEQQSLGKVHQTTLQNKDEAASLNIQSRHHGAWGSVDFQPNKNHTISAFYSFNYFNEDDYNPYTLKRTNLETNSSQIILKESKEKDITNNHVATLIYRGKVGKWDLYSDFNYNYYTNNSTYIYKESTGYNFTNQYHNRKNYTGYVANATYNFTDRTSLNLIYINRWKGYVTEDLETRKELSFSNYYRNRVYASFYHSFNPNMNAHVAGALEHIHTSTSAIKDNQLLWMVNAHLFYRFNKQYWSRFNYFCNIDYPNLDQTSSLGHYSDSLIWEVGNPYLKSSISHELRLTTGFWNRLTVIGSFFYSPDVFNQLYVLREKDIAHTTTNSWITKSYITFVLHQPICENLSLDFDNSFCHFSTHASGYRNKLNLWRGSTALNYYNPNSFVKASLSYDRLTDYWVAPQGDGTSNGNIWYAMLGKSFLGQQLNIMIQYCLPIAFGSSKSVGTNINTNFYHYTDNINPYKYARNSFELTIRYRFRGGKSVRKYNNSQTIEAE